MKIAKKSLSVFLSLLMIFSACSVSLTGLTITAAAATGTVDSVKSALTEYVVDQIVYHGHISTDKYTYKGDPAVLIAAEEVYAYVNAIRPQSNLTTADLNSAPALLERVAADTGLTSGDGYTALQYLINPPGINLVSHEKRITQTNPNHGDLGCDGHGLEYFPPIESGMSNVKKTVKIYVDVNYLLKDYDSLDAIPDSLSDGVIYEYAHSFYGEPNDVNQATGCNPADYKCTTSAWNYISGTRRTEEKHVLEDILEELDAYAETLASADLSMSFDQMMELSAADLEAVYNENYGPYQTMIDKYSFKNVEKFFGSYNQYFRDLLKAMQINLAMPAIDILMDKVDTAYDSSNYDEMAAIYTPAKAAYDVISGYGSDILDYIVAKEEYAAFDFAAAKDYLDDMKYAMDLIKLPDVKVNIENDLAAYADVNLNDLETEVLKNLLSKLDGYSATIESADQMAVSAVMNSTVNHLNNFIAEVKDIVDMRAPEDVYAVHYDYYMPLLFSNYANLEDEDVMAMYSDFDAKLDELKAAYDEQVAKYGAAIVDPLFSVTMGNGSPTLLQTAVSSLGTAQIKAELVARNSAQLAIAAGYKDMASSINLNNYVIVSTAIKSFDQALYDLCAAEENNWVSATDKALYADVQAVITAFNNFVNKLNSEGFQKVELDENGVYVVRDVYDTDLVKTEVYEVTTEKLENTIVKLDNFLASDDFGALLGFEDADGNAVGLGGYLYNMIGDLLFNNDLINMVVGMAFPMIGDLLETEVGALLAEEVSGGREPSDPFAVGYADIGSLTDAASGGIDVYIGSAKKDGQEKMHQSFAELLKGAGLYVFPTTLADSMVNSGVLTTSDSAYIALKEAGDSWKPLGNYDAETDSYVYNINLDWGITDRDSFTKALGGLLDALGGVLPTLFLNTALEKTLGSNANPAGVGYGSISAIGIVNITDAEFYASLSLKLQPLNLYSNLIQPLFGALGLEANATLSESSKGIDYANALLGPIFGLLDKIVAAPLDTILGILPNLVYILSTDYIDSFLAGFILDVSLSLGIVGSNDDGIGGLLNIFGGLLSFEVMAEQMTIADIAGSPITLSSLIGANLGNINDLLDFLFDTLGVELNLPDIDQAALLACTDWSAGNGLPKLTTDKADLLYFLIDYLMSALDQDLLDAIIGLIGGEDAEEPDEMLTTILNGVVGNISSNPDDVIAAIVELLNPVEYELKEMTWAEGADESVVYLHYQNDWSKSDSQYIIDNAMDIVATVLEMTDSEVTDINAFLNEKVNGLFADAFTNETVTKLVEVLAGIGEIPAILNDILVGQLGVDITAWANDFGYLFDDTLTAPEATVLGVSVAEVDGNLVWNGMADGDKDAFIDTLCALLAPFAPAVAFLFGGEDLGLFGVVELKGYAGAFDSSLGLLLEALGIDVPAVDFAADPMGALNTVVDAVFAWLDATLAADDLAERAVNLVAGLFRFIESNGLSVLINNLLMPVLALVDTVRPLLNVDVNTVLSVLLSDLINGEKLDTDKLLDLVLGTYEGSDDIVVTITVDNLTLSSLLKIADKLLGTNLVNSSLATIGLKGLCNADVDAADALTIILSSLIDCLDEPAADASMTNAQAIFGFIEEKTGNDQITEIVTTVLTLIEGIVYEYSAPNWGYMFGIDEEFNTVLPEHSIVYLGYKNNWTKETADAVYDALGDVLDLVLPSLLGENETIATLVNGLLEDKVYSDEILNTVVELLVNLLADLDATLFDVVDVVVDTNIAEWFTFCTFNEETGEYECTKDWGVDEATDKKATFIAAIKEVLAPANRLLAWFFFGDSYEFFTDSEKDAEDNYTFKSLITLNGGEGYAKGLVPILEALGCEMKTPDTYLVDGEYDVTAAVEDIFNALLALVDKVSDAPVEEVFKLLPNIIYFLNADGIKSSVNNLLAPVNAILAELSPIVDDISIGGLLEKEIGFDITDITTDSLLALAADAGFEMSDKHVNLIKTFYIGELEEFTSANGDYAYRMVYTDDESAGDMLTIVLSLVIDLFKLNRVLLADLLGAETYDAVMALLNLDGVKAMQEFSWLYTEYADTNKEFNSTETSEKYTVAYNNIWSRDKAEYIADHLDTFVDAILSLLGLEINGVQIKSLNNLLDSVLEGGLYTQEVADSLMDVLSNLPDLFGEYSEIGKKAISVLDEALGTDIASWETMEVTVVDGDRDSFIAALKQMLAPIVPLLDVLLCGEDISFLSDMEGADVITIYGSEGYAYGIVPLFEALGCTMMTPDEFKSLNNEDKIGAILNSLLDRVDVILANPVDEIFMMLPELIYFINSNGLDTSVKNILNSIDNVLACLEPVLGAPDLMTLLGVDLESYNFNYIINMAAEAIAGSTGLDVEPLVMDFIAELTMGKVVSYQSANGETYYKMVYAGEMQYADMLTVVLRLAIDFLATGNNADAIIALISNNAESDEAVDSANTLIKFMFTALNTEPVTSGAMAVLYWIFVGVNAGVVGVDFLYGHYGESWNAIIGFFEESDDSFVDKSTNVLKAILKEFLGVDTDSTVDDCDCDCHSNSIFVKFFFKIANFFRRLFGMNEYRTCDCGATHW